MAVNLLMPTTSFPRWHDDHAGHFVASLARGLGHHFQVTVIAPESINTADDKDSEISIQRFRWIGSNSHHSLAYGNGIMENLRAYPLRSLQIPGFLRGFHQSIQTVSQTKSITAMISHWLLPTGFIGASALGSNTTHISVIHGSDLLLLQRLPAPIRYCLMKRYLPSISHLVTVTSHQRDQLSDMIPAKYLPPVSVIPMGPMGYPESEISGQDHHYENVHQNRTSSENPPLNILFMGRLIRLKGADLLLHALKKYSWNYVLHIVGDGPERISLEKLSEQLNINVVFHGHLTGIFKTQLLRKVDIAVIASRNQAGVATDAMPTVFLEYLSRGIPVLATQTGGIPEIGRHLKNCVMVSANSPEALRRGLESIRCPELRQTLIPNGYITARQHSWEMITRSFLDLALNP